MRKIKLSIVLLSLLLIITSCEKVDDFSQVSLDSIESKGCYGYGMLLALNDSESNNIVNGSYFARGVIDYAKGELWYDIEKANRILDEYDLEYTAKGKKGERGKEVLSVKELEKLSSSNDVFLGFSYLWGYLNSPAVYSAYSDVDLNAFIAGYYDVLYEKETRLTPEEADKAFGDWSITLMEAIQKEKTARIEGNLKSAEEFLEKNKTEAGVIEISDKLQIKKLKSASDGASAENANEVVVDYKLTLLDGSVVDQGNDVNFSLNSLIPGFVQAVKNMNVGEQVLAYIHPDLGYGENDLGKIGPNSLLIFDITLKEIK